MQAKCVATLTRKRQTDQAATVRRHEINRLRRRHLGRNNQVAFVLAIFVIDKNEYPPVAGIFKYFFDR